MGLGHGVATVINDNVKKYIHERMQSSTHGETNHSKKPTLKTPASQTMRPKSERKNSLRGPKETRNAHHSFGSSEFSMLRSKSTG